MNARIVVVAGLLAATRLGAQQSSDVIRGRVTNDSGRALPGVTVIATMAPDRRVQQAVTDSAGRYELHFERGTGDYLVYAGPLGFRAFRKRVAITAPDRTLVVDIKITAEATLLATIRATAPKPRALPDFSSPTDPTGVEQIMSGLLGLLSPDQLGDLTAMAATIPGISVGPDGSLVTFGLSGQVSNTFNGMAFSGASIPADVQARVSVITSTYDPTIGGFGGARVNVAMAQGGRVPEQFAHLVLDAPPLESTGPLAAQLGQRFTRLQVSGDADGPIGDRNAWYNMGFEARRQTSSALSLLNAQPDILALAGVSPDSLARLEQAAAIQGIPLTRGGIPGSQVNQSISFLGRVDHYNDPARYKYKLWDNAVSLTTSVALNQSDAPGAGPTTPPGYGRQATGGTGQLIGQWLHISDGYASSLTSSLSGSQNTGNPYLDVPSARVLVASQLGTGDPVTSAISLGGYPTTTSSRSESWETIGVLNFYAASAHKMKVYARSMFDGANASSATNASGAFTYNTLGDFASNQPASFTRTLVNPSESAAMWRGALAVGDLWQITPSFQLQPGVRFEANHFLTTPAENPAVESTFGISNTHLPNSIHASPRLGFAWTFAPSRPSGNSGGAATGRIIFPVRSVLSGGIGEFRQDMSAGSVLGAMGSTGLASGATQLACYGTAVPTPDWQSYDSNPSSIPNQCAGGAASAFTDAAPSVQLFDPSYNLARSWRGNLQWGSIVGTLHYSVNAVYSYNLDQPGVLDLNFAGTPRFTLANEGGRPVFVPSSSIVPSTGVVSPTDARQSASFGQVLDRVSDVHSTARQATLTLVPELGALLPELRNVILRVDYTLNNVQQTARGFDGTTFASPAAFESGRSPFDVRHNIIVQTGYQWPIGIGASLYSNIRSGVPYTPMVGSDVNGDGLANDRAFVFDPARTADPVVANGMRSLLASAPSQARQCLMRQLGSAASNNSCNGPWTANMNAVISTTFFHMLDDRSAVASLNFANPLGGLDQLLHGSNNLRGWGAPALPNQTLYTVRGFDPATNTFAYAVNPRFGSTAPSQTTIRVPFRVTLSIRLELGTPRRQNDFRRFLQMAPIQGNFAPVPVDTLRDRLADLVGDVYQYLIRSRDSLLLTPEQVDVLDAADRVYRPRASAVWQDLATYIMESNGAYDLSEITRRKDAAIVRAWAVQREEIPRMLAPMTPAQRELAEIMIKPLIDSKDHPPPSQYIF